MRGVFKRKLSPKHLDFVIKYGCTRGNFHGLYGNYHFAEDEDIVIVRKIEDNDNPEAWGCVNINHELLVPFTYREIWNFGRFLIAKNSEGTYLFNKKGQMLYEINRIQNTNHKAYLQLYDAIDPYYFRLIIRKMTISKSLFQNILTLENGLAFLQNTENKVGIILFSKLKVPFEYEAIAIPQNGFTLAIKESPKSGKDDFLYDCLLMKVNRSIRYDYYIQPTGINLFVGKSWDEILDYFDNTESFEKECNSIVYNNKNVKIWSSRLEFFPFDDGLPNHQEDSEGFYSECSIYYEEERTYERYNGSYAQDVAGWSDQDIDIVFDGDPDAYWNID